jgi:hypothetical protein
MAAYRRLEMLIEAQRQLSVPIGRKVVMAARIITPLPMGEGMREFPALDPGAKVPGGRLRPIWLDYTEAAEILTWNTGQASDLRKYGNLTHAEKQFVRFMGDRQFTRVEVEISHSPCSACTDMLAGWLAECRKKGRMITRAPNRRVGRRVYIGSLLIRDPDVPAILRWGELYTTQPQATTWQSLSILHRAGWRLVAPRNALPSGSGDATVTLL